jgi:hypothetical protein
MKKRKAFIDIDKDFTDGELEAAVSPPQQTPTAEEVVKGYKEGRSIRDLCKWSGLGTTKLYRLLREQGVTLRKSEDIDLPRDLERKLVANYLAKTKVREITTRFNVTYSQLYYVLDKYKVPTRSSRAKERAAKRPKPVRKTPELKVRVEEGILYVKILTTKEQAIKEIVVSHEEKEGSK